MEIGRSDAGSSVAASTDRVGGSGWYPDPARVDELRYFDGQSWTDQVADAGKVDHVALGTPPPGLIGWPPPEVMTLSATGLPPLAEVPRVKMWILAVLSLSWFWWGTAPSRTVLPIGVLFAVWCWHTTSDAFSSHRRAGSPEVTGIQLARWVAVGLAALSVLQVAIWTR
jgi:Protein of unknown function (DUF2510)